MSETDDELFNSIRFGQATNMVFTEQLGINLFTVVLKCLGKNDRLLMNQNSTLASKRVALRKPNTVFSRAPKSPPNRRAEKLAQRAQGNFKRFIKDLFGILDA